MVAANKGSNWQKGDTTLLKLILVKAQEIFPFSLNQALMNELIFDVFVKFKKFCKFIMDYIKSSCVLSAKFFLVRI